MEKRKLNLLILEDDPEDVLLIQKMLKKGGFQFNIKSVDNEDGFIDQINLFDPDIILADYILPGYSGLDALVYTQKVIPEVPFIFVTGSIGEELATETILNGASGFVLKSNLSKLQEVLQKAVNKINSWTSKSLYKQYVRIKKQIEENSKTLNEVSEFLSTKDKDQS